MPSGPLSNKCIKLLIILTYKKDQKILTIDLKDKLKVLSIIIKSESTPKTFGS